MATRRIIFRRSILCVAGFAAFAYASDYLYVRVRLLHPKPADPFESLTTLRVLAIPEKGGKTSYEIDQQNPQQTITCVHSLFPHSGYSPCWYVKPRINQPIPIVIVSGATITIDSFGSSKHSLFGRLWRRNLRIAGCGLF